MAIHYKSFICEECGDVGKMYFILEYQIVSLFLTSRALCVLPVVSSGQYEVEWLVVSSGQLSVEWLVVSSDQWSVDWLVVSGGQSSVEWLVVSRVAGRLGHSAFDAGNRAHFLCISNCSLRHFGQGWKINGIDVSSG